MKTKILYVQHTAEVGGAPRSLYFLVKSLDRKVYEPVILFLRDGPSRALFEEIGCQVIVDEGLRAFHGTTVSGMSWRLFLRNIRGILLTTLRFPKILREIKPDIIHQNTTCMFVFSMVAKIINPTTPIICHIREPLLPNVFGMPLRIFNNLFSDYLIAICEHDKIAFAPRKPCDVVYNVVEFPKEPGQKVVRDEEQIQGLYLGRISPTNGVLEFSQMLFRVQDKIRALRQKFIIAGFGDDVNEYESAILAVCKDLEFVQCSKFSSNPMDIIGESDYIVCPFTEPHFARAIIEGAAMGLPAVGRKVGAVTELIEDQKTGYLYNDDMSFVDAIKSLSSMATRRELGDNAFKNAIMKFDISLNSKRIFAIYDKVYGN